MGSGQHHRLLRLGCGGMEVIRLREVPAEFEPTPEQLEQANKGFETVAKWNAPIPRGEGFRAWYATRGEDVIGSLTVQAAYLTDSGYFAEIGVNFWGEGTRDERIGLLAEWGRILSQHYFALGARIHPRNRAMRNILKEFGFNKDGADEQLNQEIWVALTSQITFPATMEVLWQQQPPSLEQSPA